MTDHDALVRAVCAAPLDDAPRLILADWLDEQGTDDYAAWAETIRLQVRAAHLRHVHQSGYGPCPACPAQKRAERLIAAHGQAWLEGRPLAAWQDRIPSDRYGERDALGGWIGGGNELIVARFARGMAETILCTAAGWRAHHAALRRYWPIRSVRLITSPVAGTDTGTYPAGRIRVTINGPDGPLLSEPAYTTLHACLNALATAYPGVEFDIPVGL